MDTHRHVLKNGQIDSGLVLDGTGYSETIKGSNLTNSGADGFRIVGGNEDGIDCVRGKGYTFSNGHIKAGNTRCFITAKGGIDGLVIRNVVLSGKTRWWRDIGLGDHTIYNKKKLMRMRGVTIDNVRRQDGKRVKVFVIDCEPPKCINGKYHIVIVPKWLVKLYMLIML